MPKKYKTRAKSLETNNTEIIEKPGGNNQKNEYLPLLIKTIKNPLWLSVSEAAKLGGVQTKTIRRAIKSNHLRYKVVGNRYLINLESLIAFSYTKRKLKNKLNQYGLGQYIEKWGK
ncbi:MAG: excisionase family DNA-binding protein [Patescibacteria group bacterium]|nr:excisionase family DNA-binding protein [Patescibacteria group bacterium]MDD5294632.1 excisionase family DNA-binding protein [Patescibacteria group bacterium]MDD5554396.1 excisionase family DNA-binding protein [Patescibacteria group bacterium]